MNIESYFEQEHTPAKSSPVGVLMTKVLSKNQDMDFETARQEAHRMLGRAAGRREYQIPPVYSPAEREANRARMQAAFRRSEVMQEAA
jgi:hypothetical protein